MPQTAKMQGYCTCPAARCSRPHLLQRLRGKPDRRCRATGRHTLHGTYACSHMQPTISCTPDLLACMTGLPRPYLSRLPARELQVCPAHVAGLTHKGTSGHGSEVCLRLCSHECPSAALVGVGISQRAFLGDYKAAWAGFGALAEHSVMRQYRH